MTNFQPTKYTVAEFNFNFWKCVFIFYYLFFLCATHTIFFVSKILYFDVLSSVYRTCLQLCLILADLNANFLNGSLVLYVGTDMCI